MLFTFQREAECSELQTHFLSLNTLGRKLLFDWRLAARNHEVLILVKSRSVLQPPPPPNPPLLFFSPLYRLLVQQGHTVSQSNYRSIKGFVAQPSFCQRSGRSRLRGLCRARVNEISFHVEISWEKALKKGIGGKSLLSFLLPFSMGESPSTLTNPHRTQHLKAGASGIEARGLWEYS